MSGSGAFVASAWNDTNPQLLGPVVAGESFIGTHLCAELNVTGTSFRSGYARQSYTKILEGLSWVQGDR